jgi:hypothetical protein
MLTIRDPEISKKLLKAIGRLLRSIFAPLKCHEYKRSAPAASKILYPGYEGNHPSFCKSAYAGLFAQVYAAHRMMSSTAIMILCGPQRSVSSFAVFLLYSCKKQILRLRVAEPFHRIFG